MVGPEGSRSPGADRQWGRANITTVEEVDVVAVAEHIVALEADRAKDPDKTSGPHLRLPRRTGWTATTDYAGAWSAERGRCFRFMYGTEDGHSGPLAAKSL